MGFEPTTRHANATTTNVVHGLVHSLFDLNVMPVSILCATLWSINVQRPLLGVLFLV